MFDIQLNLSMNEPVAYNNHTYLWQEKLLVKVVKVAVLLNVDKIILRTDFIDV